MIPYLGCDAAHELLDAFVDGELAITLATDAEATPRTEIAEAEMTGPFESTTARSIVFSSSRTLPGQS